MWLVCSYTFKVYGYTTFFSAIFTNWSNLGNFLFASPDNEAIPRGLRVHPSRINYGERRQEWKWQNCFLWKWIFNKLTYHIISFYCKQTELCKLLIFMPFCMEKNPTKLLQNSYSTMLRIGMKISWNLSPLNKVPSAKHKNTKLKPWTQEFHRMLSLTSPVSCRALTQNRAKPEPTVNLLSHWSVIHLYRPWPNNDDCIMLTIRWCKHEQSFMTLAFV